MTAWSADWSYAYLRGLMTKVASRHRFAVLSSAPEALASPEPVAFLRHDVDVSLDRARVLAEREAEWGVKATYHVMLSCPFYELSSPASRAALAAIGALGHEIGLHFHPPVDGEMTEPAAADDALARACERFEEGSGITPRSVSFHLPAQAMIGGPLVVGGCVNAYAKPLLEWYLSDSRARWREGEPTASLDAPRARHLQLLVHPLWWGEHNVAPGVRLHALVEELASQRGESVEHVADRVYEHILVRPEGAPSLR
jgi:hypothetical protein